MAPALISLVLLGLQDPPPAPAGDAYQPPAIRPYEMPPEEAEGLDPLPPQPELPRPVPLDGFRSAGPTDALDRQFQRRIDGMRALADGDAGPLDGAWIVTDAAGRPLYALVLSDPASGPLEGAWRDLTAPEGAAASGVIADSRRERGEVRLRFADGRILTFGGTRSALDGAHVRVTRP